MVHVSSESSGRLAHAALEPMVHGTIVLIAGIVLALLAWVSGFVGFWGFFVCFGLAFAGGRIVSLGRNIPDEVRTRDMRGRLIIITGANSGIGYMTTRELRRMGASIILACRNKTEALATIETLGHEMDMGSSLFSGQGTLEFEFLDLSDFQSIRDFARKMSDKKIYALINNAGIIGTEEYRTAACGYEETFSINHLGPFLLVKEMMESLCKNDTKVITVSSLMHALFFPKEGLDMKMLTPEHAPSFYKNHRYYGISKLCNILFARELQERFFAANSQAISVSCHPGCIMTNISNHYKNTECRSNSALQNVIMSTKWILCKLGKKLLYKPTSRGHITVTYLAALPNDQLTPGGYYMECQHIPPGKPATDVHAQKALWQLSDDATNYTKISS